MSPEVLFRKFTLGCVTLLDKTHQQYHATSQGVWALTGVDSPSDPVSRVWKNSVYVVTDYFPNRYCFGQGAIWIRYRDLLFPEQH